jgi:hypothetical protein
MMGEDTPLGYQSKGNPDDKIWEEPETLERRLSGARDYFSRVSYGPGLSDAMSALYMAEAAPENAALKEITYLAALLGFEGYISRIKHEINQKDKVGTIPAEAERYLGICSQLSDYCRSKVSYLGNDQPKKE